jgi:hypothetical protein
MIFIVVKFETRPDWTRRWPGLVERFTAATASTPKILNQTIDATGWSEMAELKIN